MLPVKSVWVEKQLKSNFLWPVSVAQQRLKACIFCKYFSVVPLNGDVML